MSKRGPRGHERVHGPYRHGLKWRVVIIGADGEPIRTESGERYHTFDGEADAVDFIARVRAETNSRTVGEAVARYLADRRASGVSENTISTERHRLEALLRLVEHDFRLATLTPTLATKLYQRRSTEVRTATHHGELRYANRWADWCVEHQWLAINPFADVKTIGRASSGKPQLRVTEAGQLLTVLVADESKEATAVMMALMMGLRAHEVVERTARDLDDGGRLLWIAKSKTRAGVRQIMIPPLLQPRLKALVAGMQPEDRIFGEMTRYALHYHTERLAKLAGVPRVTPHGLRGTFATLAVAAQLPVFDAAKVLGHADGGETMRRHYMAPGTDQSAAAERVADLLAPRAPQETEKSHTDPDVHDWN